MHHTLAIIIAAVSLTSSAFAKATVKTEQLNPADPAWNFKTLPHPSRSDVARDSRISIVGNRAEEACLSPDGLHNGVLPWQGKQTRDFFAFSNFNTNGGRIVMDLGKVQPVAAVAAYSWQGRYGPGFIQGQRAPQVYALYGSAAANPDAAHLDSRGWVKIAEVDMAVFPRDQKPDAPRRAQIAEITKLIAEFGKTPGVSFLDIGPKLLQPDGTISRQVMGDFCHPTEDGYQIWSDALIPLLN